MRRETSEGLPVLDPLGGRLLGSTTAVGAADSQRDPVFLGSLFHCLDLRGRIDVHLVAIDLLRVEFADKERVEVVLAELERAFLQDGMSDPG